MAALVIDAADGALGGVMEELDELGFRVIWVPSLATALEFVKARPKLSLIIASSAATRVGPSNFLTQVKIFSPDVRLIWGVRADSRSNAPAPSPGQGPDSLIPEPFRPNDLRAVISELLAEHFYPTAIVETIKSSAIEVLRAVGEFEVEGGAFLVPNRTALSELSAVITFGGGVSGHLIVGMTTEHARMIQQAMFPGSHPVRIDRMEDLVGELCNQLLGRINVFFQTHGVSIVQGTPIYIRAPGSSLRYAGRQPSLALTLAHGVTRVMIEYYLADFNHAKLEAPVATRVLPLREVSYL